MSYKVIIRLVLALVLTMAAGYYQRKTGPTHPVKDKITWQGSEISYELLRSYDGEGDQPVTLTVADTSMEALLVYRKYRSGDPWTGMLMKEENLSCTAMIPHQPPAGKVEYFIVLNRQDQTLLIPEDRSVVTRFKGAVPAAVLLPHIFLMFIAMLFSTAAGLEALVKSPWAYRFAIWATVTLFIGGMILGPLVQKFAFGEFWTGVPFGFDLTDNKTLLAMLAWIVAVWKGRSNKPACIWIISAAIILLLVYSIPHSVMGSELNYQTMQIQTGR
jgi:hypothetical protein